MGLAVFKQTLNMKKILTLAVGTLLLAVPLSAQTVYDAAQIANKDLNGTARFVGMGGAMSALGGDISTIATNPAGIGIYRSNDLVTTFGLSAYGTESSFQGNKWSADNMRGDFDNIGLVWSNKIGNVTTLRYVNFGFNYKRAKSFYRNMEMGGNMGNLSQTYQMAWQASGSGIPDFGITNWGDYPFEDPNVGWLSAIGYKGYVIDPADDKGNYVGMYNNADASFRSEERGGVDQYDFNLSFNLSDRIYLGVTIGAYSVNYNKYTYYGENYTGVDAPQKYSLQSWNKIEGSGFDVKLGAIVRPFETSPLRIGFAVHTPTFYNLDYRTSAYISSDVLNAETGTIDQWELDTRSELAGGGDMVRSFRLRTPWTYNVSLGYTVGQNFAFGAEYEYQDYSSMEFQSPEGFSSDFEWENSAMPMLKGVSTFRVGMEYKVIPQFAFRAGYNFQSALFKSDAFKDLPFNSIQTDTDFANTKALNNYTIGIGYRGSMFYADLAYKFSSYKSDFYPFANFYTEGGGIVYETPEVTKVTNTRSQVLLTLGVRF